MLVLLKEAMLTKPDAAFADTRRGIQIWQSMFHHASVLMRETLSLLVSAGKPEVPFVLPGLKLHEAANI